MSVSPVSSNSAVGSAAYSSTGAIRRRDLKSLVNSLQSGDMAGAQKAFRQMLTDSPRLAKAVNSGSSSSGNSRLSAFQALSAALKSGDLSSAQDALSTLMKGASPTADGQPPYHALAGASGMA